MQRKTAIRAALLVTPLLAFLLYAALNWFRVVDHRDWSGMQPEALRNPYLAYSRLLERMGAGAELRDISATLALPPERGVMLVGARRLVYMTPDHVERLAAWVRRGGLLVIEAERSDVDDPLLEAFGVDRERVEEPRRRRTPAFGAPLATFSWRAGQPELRVEFPPGAPALRVTKEQHELRAGSAADRSLALAFAEGNGRVVVLSSFAFLRNGSIGREDHAELGWQLATDGGTRKGATLALRPSRASLAQWLRDEAWPVAVAASLLIALWLARVIPRFGPLDPDPQPVRRRLGEHIAASGRFLWSRGERQHLLDAARERVWQMAARRFAAARSRKPEAVDSLADALGMNRFQAQRALNMRPVTDEAFTAGVAALQSIESRLGRRAGALKTTKETK